MILLYKTISTKLPYLIGKSKKKKIFSIAVFFCLLKLAPLLKIKGRDDVFQIQVPPGCG